MTGIEISFQKVIKHQNENLIYCKEDHQQSEKATYGMGKAFTNHISNKRLIYKI